MAIFSLSRAIEQFSISRQETRLRKKIAKDRLNALPGVFRTSMEALEKAFSKAIDDLHIDYPRVDTLSYPELHAFLVTLHLEVGAFPSFVKLLREGRGSISSNHYERDGAHTFMAHGDEFSGKSVRLLTNDLRLIEALSSARFRPPPPWIVWYDVGPCPYNQGNPEYWTLSVWIPYWNSLSVAERETFLAEWREETRAYLSEDEWESWMFKIRMEESPPAGQVNTLS